MSYLISVYIISKTLAQITAQSNLQKCCNVDENKIRYQTQDLPIK